MKKYDYLIVGSGLFGSVFAYEATKKGKKCLVLEKRRHVGGNIYTEKIEDINIHVYGAHIFHTNSKNVWDYMNKFVEFNRYTNSPIAKYKDEIYNLPFNMNTFNKLWGVFTPEEAKNKIELELNDVDIKELGDEIRFEVSGNGFLYNMVRIIVGTLVKVGQGKIPPEQVKEMIEQKRRSLGGKTMEPQGLYLKSVKYQEKFLPYLKMDKKCKKV